MTTKAHVAMAEGAMHSPQLRWASSLHGQISTRLRDSLEYEDDNSFIFPVGRAFLFFRNEMAALRGIGTDFNFIEHATQPAIYECLPKKLP